MEKFEMKRNSVYFLSPLLSFSLFILRLFFLEGEKEMDRESDGDKKCTEFRSIKIGKNKTMCL